MAKVTLDTITDAQLDQQMTTGRIVRTATVEDLDGLSASDSEMMFNARAEIISALGGQAEGSATYPGHSEYVLQRIFIRGFMSNGIVAQLFYQAGGGGVQPSTFILRYSSVATQYEGTIIPGMRKPIRVGWTGTGTPTGPAPVVQPDNVPMRFFRPALALSVSGLIYGTANVGVQQSTPLPGLSDAGLFSTGSDTVMADAVASVNDSNWPVGLSGITSRAAGFWLILRYETVVSRYSGFFSYEATAISRVFEDWSETGILRSRMTGRFVEIDQTTQDHLNSPGYSYGYIFPPDETDQVWGAVRIGGNPTTNFTTVFGF